MQLNQELKRALREYGYPILLVRQNRHIRCRCWDPDQQSVNPTCPYCFGAGYVARVERHRVLGKVGQTPESLTRILRPLSTGDMDSSGHFLYMQSDAAPGLQDQILFTPFEQGRPKIIQPLTKLYEVNHVDPYFIGETIEYVRVAALETPMNARIKAVQLRQVAGVVNYDLQYWGRP